MKLFFGYDPGGKRENGKDKPKNGVVAVEIDECGRIGTSDTASLLDAGAVLAWFRARPFAAALGVDTLLAWSLKGDRSCDGRLKRFYGERIGSASVKCVQPQNSLHSAMTVNGVLVATKAQRELGLPLAEGHPKLLLAGKNVDGEPLLPRRVIEKHEELSKDEKGSHDHRADAFIAAWCASRWYFRDPDWQTDLYGVDAEDPLFFPAGPAVYPWPEQIASNNG